MPTTKKRIALPLQEIDRLQVVACRGSLPGTLRALAAGKLTVGFLGGSITEGWETTWPGPVARWLAEKYPDVAIVAENAAIGATGSDSGCLRVDHEIISRGCDVVFVEYAVNDSEQPGERRGRTREGLLRKLLAAGHEVILVHTYRQEFYDDMIQGRMPASVAEFERLAEHYGLSSIWVGLHAFNGVRAGRMSWEEWLPDGLHPGPRGSWTYAEAIIAFLAKELNSPASEVPDRVQLPSALDPLNWQSLSVLPLTAARAVGPWVLKRLHGSNHVEQVLETHTPGAQLSFEFTGRGLALICDYGKRAAEFRYRLDNGEWIPITRERPNWCGDRGLVRALLIADDLAPGQHSFELEVVHGNHSDCTGTEFRLAVIGVL